ncbi:MAG: TraR/DksA family transcriptional regulator [Streptosporangiaceae bacterium]
MDLSAARKRLEEIRDDLDRSISVLRGEHQDDRGASTSDVSDAGLRLSETAGSQALLLHAASQRSEIQAALVRIEDGSYGHCVDCAKPVPEGRLEARPDASRCVACQGKRDRRRR